MSDIIKKGQEVGREILNKGEELTKMSTFKEESKNLLRVNDQSAYIIPGDILNNVIRIIESTGLPYAVITDTVHALATLDKSE